MELDSFDVFVPEPVQHGHHEVDSHARKGATLEEPTVVHDLLREAFRGCDLDRALVHDLGCPFGVAVDRAPACP